MCGQVGILKMYRETGPRACQLHQTDGRAVPSLGPHTEEDVLYVHGPINLPYHLHVSTMLRVVIKGQIGRVLPTVPEALTQLGPHCSMWPS